VALRIELYGCLVSNMGAAAFTNVTDDIEVKKLV